MASGAQHFKRNCRLSIVLVICYGIYTYLTFDINYINYTSDTIFLSIGLLCALLFTPDIDIPGKTYTEYLIEYYLNKVYHSSFGIIIKNVYFVLTYPYGFFIPHRSWFSHFPIIGTLTKFSYFVIIYGIVTWHVPINVFSYHTVLVLVPWIILDTQHFIDDGGMYIGLNGNQNYFFGKQFYEKIRKRNAVQSDKRHKK